MNYGKSMISLLHYLFYGYRTCRQPKIPSFFKNNTYDTSNNSRNPDIQSSEIVQKQKPERAELQLRQRYLGGVKLSAYTVAGIAA